MEAGVHAINLRCCDIYAECNTIQKEYRVINGDPENGRLSMEYAVNCYMEINTRSTRHNVLVIAVFDEKA